MIRRIPITLVALAATLLFAAPACAAKRHRRSVDCPQVHSHVLVADAQAVIYVETDGANEVQGCLGNDRPSLALGESWDEVCTPSGCGPQIDKEVLSGDMVAYQVRSAGESEYVNELVVRNLRTGRILHRVPTGTLSPAKPNVVGVGPVYTLLIEPDGSLAWVVVNEGVALGPGESKYYEVHVLDNTGSRVLAAGYNVELASLALSDNRVYWTQGGQVASATLR
jgi:hypothetical protein